jgi:hypothetical protein
MKKRVEGMKEAGETEAFKDDSLFRAFGKPGESKVTVADVVKLSVVPKSLEEFASKDHIGSTSGLINDTEIDITKDSVKVKSGWEGKKVPEDGKLDCASKSGLMSILGNIEGADKALTELSRKFTEDAKKEASLIKSDGKTEEEKKAAQELIKELNATNKAVSVELRIYKDTVVQSFKYVKKCVDIHEKGSKDKKD